MKMRLPLTVLCALAAVLPALPASAQQPAQTKRSTVGTIDLDAEDEEAQAENNRQLGVIKLEREERKRDPYFDNQDAAIEFFEKLHNTLAGLEQGAAPAPPAISDGALAHAAAGYLLCSIKKGTCPDYLLALREVDLLNSISNADATKEQANVCSTMRRFWQQWLNNDMQKKMEYQVHMSYMRARDDFNQKVLPGFVPPGCEVAIKDLAAQAAANRSAFFKKRYEAANNPKKAARNVTSMLKLFREKNVHLFASTMPR